MIRPHHAEWRRVRVGQVALQSQAKLLRVTLRFVDAVFLEKEVIHLVEAKLKPDAGAIAQLKLYNNLFGQTPEFMALWNLPRKLILLTTREDPEVVKLAIQEGIEYEVFKPPFLEEK